MGSDIRKGKKTLMVIHALGNASTSDLETLNRALGNKGASDEEVEKAVAVLRRAGSIDYAKEVAGDYNQRSWAHLNKLPESEHKGRLSQLMEFMVDRKR